MTIRREYWGLAVAACLVNWGTAFAAETKYALHFVRAGVPTRLVGESETSFASDEEAARYYLQKQFERELPYHPHLLGPGGQRPTPPTYVMKNAVALSDAGKRILRFEQAVEGVPVFGTSAVVELDENRQLLLIGSDLRKVDWLKVSPSLTPEEAEKKLVDQVHDQLDVVMKATWPPRLCLFQDQKHDGAWHLAYQFEVLKAEGRPLPAARWQAFEPSSRGLLYNFLVDARTGEVLSSYSSQRFGATPGSSPYKTPTKAEGVDDDGQRRSFFVSQDGGRFVMEDPVRRIRTLDMDYHNPYVTADEMTSQGLATEPKLPKPGTPIYNDSASWMSGFEAAVSAQANATKVYDFYEQILHRKGIFDDKGFLVSVVHCTDPEEKDGSGGRAWGNAQWDGERMVYGQALGTAPDKTPKYISFARYVDIIGHELTHGVTGSTSDLFYQDESGALNESLSDIMGILIKNWDPSKPDQDPSTFDWEIGHGLGQAGGPIRDLSDPRKGDCGRRACPDHIRNFLRTSSDAGGVHTNSNINNKAAYNLLTAKDKNNHYLVPWKEVALLYYSAQVALPERADFKRMRQGLLDAATLLYAGDDARSAKLAAIRKAYDDVGITE